MAEIKLDLRHQPKDRAYAQLHSHMLSVLTGIDNDIAGMATLASLLHHAFGFLWTGKHVSKLKLIQRSQIQNIPFWSLNPNKLQYRLSAQFHCELLSLRYLGYPI